MQLFQRVQTQWRTGPMGGVIGFDYPAVETLARLAGITVTPDMMDGLQVMEGAALAALNAARRR